MTSLVTTQIEAVRFIYKAMQLIEYLVKNVLHFFKLTYTFLTALYSYCHSLLLY